MGQSTMDNTSETMAVFLAITQELLQTHYFLNLQRALPHHHWNYKNRCVRMWQWKSNVNHKNIQYIDEH